MRDTAGAADFTDCQLCRGGYYCPNDTINTQGIPCRATFECPTGASIESDCRPGHYCPPVTGVPPICPPGYYCPNATETPILCVYPFYCPEGSNMTLACDLGYQALTHAGIRYDKGMSCRICPPGYFGNSTDRATCELCPAGFYCPAGTGHGNTNPCPIGTYCPIGSDHPTNCPAGFRGEKLRAESYHDCHGCPAGTYSDTEAATHCKPCGSSSYSTGNSSICTCIGKYRSFQKSVGSCVCLSGYIYYDETDTQQTEENSDEDCQQIVDTRCSEYEVRLSATRQCVLKEYVNCNAGCDSSGYLDVELGVCLCNDLIAADYICDASCLAVAPAVTAELQADGTLQVQITNSSGHVTSSQTMTDIFGPLESTNGVKGVMVVNFYDDRITSSIFRDQSEAKDLFLTSQEMAQGLTNAPGTHIGRRRLLSTLVPNNQISNSLLCLELNEMVMFKIWINDTDRTKSHYPVYLKDHLFSNNPNFDYGQFLALKNLIETTNVNISTFAFVFTEAGNYVFQDYSISTSLIYIKVMNAGTTCGTGSRVQAATASNLVALGFYKSNPNNVAPDWGLIIGMIAFFGALVLLLVVAVIVWRPRHAGIYPMKHWTPKYRSLGAPPPVPSYMRYDVGHWPAITDSDLGERLTGDGAEADVLDTMAVKGMEDLENFNVRVFYDKMEDQNLHLASQLAKQQEDLKSFYKKICDQNEELKQLLKNLDPAKLEELERKMAERAKMEEGMQKSAGDVFNIVNGKVNMGGAGKYRFAGGNNREAELMASLQLLLDRLNSGDLPISQSVWEQIQKGGAVPEGGSITNINRMPGGAGKQGELLRKQREERMQLDRELQQEENDMISDIVSRNEDQRKDTVNMMTDGLAGKLQGDLKDSQVKDILDKYEKDLDANMNKFNLEKEKQLQDLRRKLAEKRRRKEALLREKHNKEAEEAGLPPPLVEDENVADTKIRQSEALYDTLLAEEAAGAAKGEGEIEHQLSDEKRRLDSEKMQEHLNQLAQQGIITTQQKDELLRKHLEAEQNLQKVHNQQRDSQISHLKDKLADRRKKKLAKLRSEQEQELSELSSHLIEDGNTESLEEELEQLKRLHKQQMEAAEAEMDAEEKEHERRIIQKIDEEHDQGSKKKRSEIFKQIADQCPEQQKTAMQRLLDNHHHDTETLEQELAVQRSRHLADLQAKLAARRARKLAEVQRKQDEEEQQRLISEQNRQMQQGGHAEDEETDLAHVPKVQYSQSIEEQALQKEQERIREEMKKRHKQDREKMGEKLDTEEEKEERLLTKELDSEKEKLLREKKNRQATERSARKDLTEEQIRDLMASHEQELQDLEEKLENDRHRQFLSLKERLNAKRNRKMDELRRKQDVETTKEIIEQKKEVDEIKLKKAKGVEHDAIVEGIKQNGEEDTDKVVRAVLAKRHAQEMQDLENQFKTKKKLLVDDALSKLHEKYDKLRDSLAKQHQEELAALQKKGLSPEEYQHQRTQLLNKQQLEMADLERRLTEEEQEIERGALTDWEVQYARAKLDLKEKHYKEFAEALKEFSPDHEGIQDAQHNVEELEKLKHELEQKRKNQLVESKKQHEEFEKNEKKRLEAEMEAYAKQLEKETSREKEQQDRKIEQLNKRKEDMVKEKKQKMNEELEKIKQQGASEDEQKRLIEQHERDLQNILNKMDADKMRMQSNLQERLKKKKEERLKNKQEELKENFKDQKRELEQKQKSEINRIKKDEALAIQESISSGYVPPRASSPSLREDNLSDTEEQATSTPPQDPMPSSYQMAAPLNEAELMSLLMASPVYQKLEQIKDAVKNGISPPKHKMEAGEGYQDSRDAEWSKDTELVPVDIGTLNARSFIVYKFGCFVTDLISTRCRHSPVTILLADKIPSNKKLARNSFRNSFHYDANNRILYIRAARLETVGDFIVVLIHSLAHIKAGDLRDDSNPDFVKEYNRALAVVCDDLFFARYRKTTGLSQSIAKSTGVNVEQAALQMLQAMFGGCRTEDEKMKMVDDLLDVKLLPGTNMEGVHFNKNRLNERLSKYSGFSNLNQLQSMLGNMEDKMAQAKSQGTAQGSHDQLCTLSHRFSTSGSSVLNKLPPFRFVTANMTGQALWQTFVNSEDGEEVDAPREAIVDSLETLQERHDNLTADFANINTDIIELQDRSRSLDEELAAETQLMETGKDKDKHAQLAKKLRSKLNDTRARIARLEMEKNLMTRKLAECEKDMQMKKQDPQQSDEKSVSFSADSKKKSKK